MRVLIVVDSIDIDENSGSKANVSLIQNLKKAGFELLVFHYSRKEINLDSITCVSMNEAKFSVFYFLSRLQRIISRITKININPKIESLLGFSFTFFNDVNSIKKSLRNIEDFSLDWILTLSYASSFRPHKALLSFPEWHSKWLAYVHDPYPMHSYPRPYDWVEPGHQFKRDFFLQVTEKAKYIIYPSKLLAEWMESYYQNQKGKEIIIPHQNSDEAVDFNLLPDFFNPSHFNILHAGNMMSARNPITLIEAFEAFLEKNPEAQSRSNLMFIGKSSCFDEYIKEKQKTMPQLFLSDDYMSFKEVLALQESVSVNVILEALGPLSPFLPGKFVHCVRSKKPILLLGPFYSETRRLLGEDYPYWSAINDKTLIQKHIEELYGIWLKDKQDLILERPDLTEYLSDNNLKNIITTLQK